MKHITSLKNCGERPLISKVTYMVIECIIRSGLTESPQATCMVFVSHRACTFSYSHEHLFINETYIFGQISDEP